MQSYEIWSISLTVINYCVVFVSNTPLILLYKESTNFSCTKNKITFNKLRCSIWQNRKLWFELWVLRTLRHLSLYLKQQAISARTKFSKNVSILDHVLSKKRITQRNREMVWINCVCVCVLHVNQPQPSHYTILDKLRLPPKFSYTTMISIENISIHKWNLKYFRWSSCYHWKYN